MIRFLFILLISILFSKHCLSQLVTKETKQDKTDIAQAPNSKNSITKMPAVNNSNFILKDTGISAILLDVLFATNEDCDLYVGEEFKGTVNRSKHKYLKLPPGSYVYKAKSKSTFDELKETFVVRDGDSNEVFIDLLYVVDENSQQRESIKNKNLIDSQILVSTKNKIITPKLESNKIEPNKEAENKTIIPSTEEKKIEPNKETGKKIIVPKPEEKKIETSEEKKIEPYKEVEKKIVVPKPEEKKIPTNKKAEDVFINAILSDMVSINEGNFIMGNNKAQSNDEIEHPVTIGPLLFSRYEVTQQQWENVMGYNPSNNKDCSTCPVENVSWEEAMDFIIKLNEISNKKFRLPTEAEWEYVAKIGGKSEIDKEGGPEKYIKKTAWYSGNSNKKTHPVGEKQPNVSGIYDLLGNVSEWCADWYEADFYKKAKSQKNPGGPISGTEKVIRGGSYNDSSADRFRPSLRNKLKPESKSLDIGFRIVMEVN